MVQLVEKSPSVPLCRFLLDAMRTWVLRGEAFPTVKEKAGVLVKMLCFEARDADLFRALLDLILAIYREPAFVRTELTARLEPAFLRGCRHPDASMRRAFIDIFDASLTRSLPGRLLHLLGHQSWESLADSYWVHPVLDLLLAAMGDGGAAPLLAALRTLQYSSADACLLYTSPSPRDRG